MPTVTTEKPVPAAPAAPLEYASPFTSRRRPMSPLALLLWLLFGAGAVALLASLLAPPCCRATESANRTKCAANLRVIGQALRIYANGHGGRLPDSLDQLYLAMPDDLSSESVMCPSSADERATGATPKEVAAKMANPPDARVRHVSYIYLGNGTNLQSLTSDTVPAYDHPENHSHKGINVLFGDGRVEFVTPERAAEIIPGLNAGDAE